MRRGADVVGSTVLTVQDAWTQVDVAHRGRDRQAELGWTLHPAHQDHGYANEADRALLRLCFEELGVRRVEASCFAANTPSRKVMDRVGPRLESKFIRMSYHRELGWVAGCTYAMLAEGFAATPLRVQRQTRDPG